jgi:hypothetical protein
MSSIIPPIIPPPIEKKSLERETFPQKTLKYLKILLPHVGLNILLFTYISLGAIVFIFLEVGFLGNTIIFT